jgi:hypothetical protein
MLTLKDSSVPTMMITAHDTKYQRDQEITEADVV